MQRVQKAWLSMMLVIALVLGVLPVSSMAEKTVTEWTYDNSIVVTVTVDTPQQFTPEDFPEVECKRVVAVSKSTDEDGITYKLVLVLGTAETTEMEKAIEVIQKNPKVQYAHENEMYEQCDPEIILNCPKYVLRVGETIDLQIAYIKGESSEKLGIFFEIDPSVIADGEINKHSFEKYGIRHFWPCSYPLEPLVGPPYPDTDELWMEGCQSDYNLYFAPIYYDSYIGDEDDQASFDKNFRLLEAANRLACDAGVSNVLVPVETNYPPGPIPTPEQTWTSDDPEIAALTVKEETPYKYLSSATVRGLRPGTTTVTIKRDTSSKVFMNRSITALGTCTIEVIDKYCDGDVNRDGYINALDALLVLQQSVSLIMLDVESWSLANMDDNPEVNAADALVILQMSVGL